VTYARNPKTHPAGYGKMSDSIIFKCGKCDAQNLIESKALTTSSIGYAPNFLQLPTEKIEKAKTVIQLEDILGKFILSFLKEKEKQILAELETIQVSDQLSQIKTSISLVESLIARLKEILDMDAIRGVIGATIEKAFMKGNDQAENELKLEFVPNEKAIDFIRTHTFGNVKDMNDEIASDLRAEFERGLLNLEGPREIKKRVLKVFDVNETRAMAIARTEINRAVGYGTLEGYLQSGLEGEKEWVAHIDKRTSDICRRNNGQRVPLKEKFKDKKTGEEFMTNPFHINCRSRIIMHPTPVGNVTDYEKKAVKYWHDHGIGASEQSRILGRDKSTVYRIYEKLELN